jgi:hypothetical protein
VTPSSDKFAHLRLPHAAVTDLLLMIHERHGEFGQLVRPFMVEFDYPSCELEVV